MKPKTNAPIRNDVSIVLSGAAGQGIQAVESILTPVLKSSGYHVFATKEYMSRVRGGNNTTAIRVSSGPVDAFVERIDVLIPLNKGALDRLRSRITKKTVLLGEEEFMDPSCRDKGCEAVFIPFSKMASDMGNVIFANIITVGVLSGILSLDPNVLAEHIKKYFSNKGDDIIQKNLESARKGHEIGADLLNKGKIRFLLKKGESVKGHLVLSGAEAVGLGALAGGCNFLSAYPMTPSTGVLTFLSQQSNRFDIVVEQAEDEISAINMALGASYAGARAMVTTSGGGFALMVEGVSLAGMLEQPIVILLGQRPGPATGLPTRTEQGDLELALYAGHGAFPRIILAPSNLEDAFLLCAKAFNLADKYQSPVFLLTDQYLMDSYYDQEKPDLSANSVEKYVQRTTKDYKRYAFTASGLSPRGIPGFGEGLVGVDSDEHDEAGHITEDGDVRNRMVEKRLKKLSLMEKDVIKPRLMGSPKFKTLIVSWGSTLPMIREALIVLGREDVSLLHFSQVYPLHKSIAGYLNKARRSILIENNERGQFGRLIRQETGMTLDHRILKYDGMPFSVEELSHRIKQALSR